MPHRPWFPASSWTAAVLLAAVALGVWAASRTAEALGIEKSTVSRPSTAAPLRKSAPERSRSARDVRSAPGLPVPAAAPEAAAALAARLDEGTVSRSPPGPWPEPPRPAVAEAEEPQPPAAGAESARLTEGLARLARDLEFNAGLPEPPQQLVVRPPEPWRPSEGAGAVSQPVIVGVEPRSAPGAGGARVVIRGQNLRPGQVMFGQAPARILSATGDAVTVVAPAGAGPVVIAVTNDDGAFALSSVPFTYRDAPRRP
jgi:hypothetical protein